MPPPPVGVTVTRTRSPARNRAPVTRNGVVLRAKRRARRVGAEAGPRGAAVRVSGRAKAAAPAARRTTRAMAAASRMADPWSQVPLGCALPGVDEAVAAARVLGRRGGERGGDEPTRVGRVDHVVELEERRRVERLGVGLGGGGELPHARLALAGVPDLLELAAGAEAD